ncbi:MAG: hypothetical protein ACP5RC_06645 [Halothiobacillaceae bacterium]
MPDHVADDEPLARFLTSDSQFNSQMAKPAAFMPGPKDGNTSVFRQAAEPAQALWDTADRELGIERRAKAAALFTAGSVRRARLEVVASEPPLRHADITQWPEIANDPEATKAQRKELALLLIQSATLCRR